MAHPMTPGRHLAPSTGVLPASMPLPTTAGGRQFSISMKTESKAAAPDEGQLQRARASPVAARACLSVAFPHANLLQGWRYAACECATPDGLLSLFRGVA